MHISGQYFSPSILDQIRETVKTEPSISRLNLSRRVCEWLNWKSPNGKLKDMSCRKALNKLNKSGIIALPVHNNTYAFEHTTINSVEYDIPQLECTLEELEDIDVYPVTSRYAKESKIWFSLLDNYHYLRSGSICGNQIRYLVKSSRGYLGALSFSSASWALKARDDYIEWTEGARRAHIDKVICNSRFLILPTVHVPNLASHILSLAVSL